MLIAFNVSFEHIVFQVTASLRDIDGKNSIRVVDIAHLSSSVAAMDYDVASQVALLIAFSADGEY